MAKPPVRPYFTHLTEGQTIYRGLFAESPNAYLILTPDLQIINGNDAYLALGGKDRDELVGRYLFDIFPDNPTDTAGANNLLASFNRVRASGQREIMPLQRYDAQNQHGIWERRYWYPANWAIIDDDGTTIAMIHHVTEATEQAQLARLIAETRAAFRSAHKSRAELERLITELEKSRRLPPLP
jgi:PAS domain S-box-containing protein